MILQKRWTILPFQQEETIALKEALGININLCKILTQRGINSFEDAKNYFRPSLAQLHSPWLMKDMRSAVKRIVQAISSNEKVLVLGDYDVDGTTAIALLYSFLKTIYTEQNLDFYVPHRYREGYGLSRQGIDFAKEGAYSLILTLDCGIKSVELVDYANSKGVDVIICDHHLPDEVLPAAVAVLNPKQKDCNYPYKELCGCGVAFKLVCAIAEELHLPIDIPFSYMDLVATAIGADIVPITGENRILAFFGLKIINEKPRPGIAALRQLAGAKNDMSINNVVFIIAPRVNAAGRMDDARKAVLLFLAEDEKTALEYAEMLHSDNSERKETDKNITEHALEMINADPIHSNKKSSVVYNEHWHKGVVGIVASRLIETHYRPTVVLTKSGNLLTGSARSVPGFNLYEAIYACKDLLVAYGGHFAAAGLSMHPENLEHFTKKFDEVVSGTIDEKLLIPEIQVNADIDFADITQSFYNIICQMEPFGPENMRPVFLSKNVTDTGYSKVVKDAHLKLSLKQNERIISGIGFNLAQKFELLKQSKAIDILYTIDENEWNGNKTLQLKVIDIEASKI